MLPAIRPTARICLAALLMLCGQFRADAPKVVEIRPADGAKDVSPSTREIRVVFDQSMNRGGFSIVGGGENFPEATGRPRWVDEKTCVMPVRLRPNHDYRLSINSERFQNFRSRGGVPAVPYPVQFHTGAAEDAKPLTANENRKAVAELRRAIDEDYSYRDLHHVDWPAAFRAAEPKLLAAKSPIEFAKGTADLLAPAKDVHLWLSVDGEIIGTHRSEYTPNFSLGTLRKVVPGWEPKGLNVAVGKFPDGIVYVLVATWDPSIAKEMDAVYEALGAAEGAKGLFIDVRPNSGGAEPLAQEFAGCFVDAPKVYSKHVIREGGKDGPTRDRVLRPNKGRPKFRGKVAVLMGQKNLSSCESFLLMMKQAGATLVGVRSRGSSGNPQPHDLGNGVIAFIPCWRDLRPDGTGLEGEGVKPDVEVKTTPNDFAKSDPVLEAALKVLRGK